MRPFGSASAWTLVVVEVVRLFGSLVSQKGRDVEETRLSEAITACVDTFEVAADRCLEPVCETCPPDLEGKWTSRIYLAPLLAQLIHCFLRCRRRNGGPPRWSVYRVEHVQIGALGTCPVTTGR